MISKRIRLSILFFLILILGGFIIWLYQSHSPLKKVYTSDRQYSYYLEEYNYNVIFEKILPSGLYETDYKVFICDEITEKKLRSGYAGGKTLMSNYFGFDECGDKIRFHFTKPDYFELPRLIDKKAIEQREREERTVRDSIRWEREKEQTKEKFNQLQLITQEEVEYIAPVIKEWTDYFQIDLAQARFIKTRTPCFNCPPDTANPYYWDFAPEDNSPSLIQMSYSPNKQLYVDMIIAIDTIDGNYYDLGEYDIDQAVYLVDRRQRHKNLLFFNGSSTGVNDTFWKNNNVFITVGTTIMYKNLNKYLIHVFDIKKRTIREYEVLTDKHPDIDFGSYHGNKYLKERGIIPCPPPLCKTFKREKDVWSTDYADGNWYLIRGMELHHPKKKINQLISAWNTAYPIDIELKKVEDTTAYVEIINGNDFAKSHGSSGANRVIAALVYTLTEDYRYRSIHLNFEEGDHASPGIYTRADFQQSFLICR